MIVRLLAISPGVDWRGSKLDRRRDVQSLDDALDKAQSMLDAVVAEAARLGRKTNDVEVRIYWPCNVDTRAGTRLLGERAIVTFEGVELCELPSSSRGWW